MCSLGIVNFFFFFDKVSHWPGTRLGGLSSEPRHPHVLLPSAGITATHHALLRETTLFLRAKNVNVSQESAEVDLWLPFATCSKVES